MSDEKVIDEVSVDEFVQGSTYEESAAGSDEELHYSSSRVGLASKVKTNVVGNKKLLLIGGAVVALLLVLLVGMFLLNLKKENDEAYLASLENTEELEFKYAMEEVLELRLAGYTGGEIEMFEQEELSAEDKIQESINARKQKYDAEIKPYLDGASPEFLELKSNTWVGGKPFTYNQDDTMYNYFTYNLNADYEKIPPHGHQLFIKFYLGNGAAAFMDVTPERYAELASEGNIVVSVTYTDDGAGAKIITDIQEIRQD